MSDEWAGRNVEWRDDVKAANFKGTHVFLMTDCYWSNDPDAEPDLRSVCAHCGLDEELGNVDNPCIAAPEQELADDYERNDHT